MLSPGHRHLASRLPAKGWSPDDPLIVDCTAVPRFGLRGRGGCDWLRADGVALPETVNRAAVDGNGILAMRLGANEAVLSGDADGRTSLAALRRRWADAEGRNGYDGFREDSWAHVLVSGKRAFDLMAEMAEIDFRPAHMPVGHVAQTRALHLDAVIVRTDRFGPFGYEIFLDITSKAFFLDALARLDGGYRLLVAGPAPV